MLSTWDQPTFTSSMKRESSNTALQCVHNVLFTGVRTPYGLYDPSYTTKERTFLSERDTGSYKDHLNDEIYNLFDKFLGFLRQKVTLLG